MEQQDFEVGDVESFSSGKDLNYSRSATIMRQTLKVQEDLSREMKPSFMEIKRDKFGNETKTLTDDSRYRACSSIQTLRNLLQCDFDSDIEKDLKGIDKEIKDEEERLLKKEKSEWESLDEAMRFMIIKKGLFRDGSFNRNKPYGELFVKFLLQKHREIFESLIRLQKRNDFYKGESFEA